MELFGKEVNLRTHYCKYFDKESYPVEDPYTLLYVRFKGCNAHCKFCEYQNDANIFNEEKFFNILNELKGKVIVKKIAFTGGEPTMDLDKFKHIITETRRIIQDTYLVVNTNGSKLKELFTDPRITAKIDNFSISRHHYDDDKNNEIFGIETISTKDLKKLRKQTGRKKLLHLSCNLTKGYIDNEKEVINFLEYANYLKMKTVGFVSLMPINDFSKDNFIDFNALDLLNENFRKIKEWSYEDICKCNNYVYIPKDYKRIIEVYYKNTYKPECININLTYDGENLKNGFSNNIIY